MPSVKPIPDGYPTVTPYMVVDGAAAAIDYYKSVLGARERMRLSGPGGSVGHAELEIGSSLVMLADESPDAGALAPKSYGGSPVHLSVFVEDVDAVVAKAVAAGAEVTRPVKDQFYGDRVGHLVDPFGHHWSISTHIEDVSPEEMGRRAGEQAGSG